MDSFNDNFVFFFCNWKRRPWQSPPDRFLRRDEQEAKVLTTPSSCKKLRTLSDVYMNLLRSHAKLHDIPFQPHVDKTELGPFKVLPEISAEFVASS